MLTKGDERFTMLGYQPNATEYIKASNLLILPSIHEGLPLVVIEAMAVGTPVIATNIYGIPELIEDGVNGKLVPIKDSKSIANAIEFIYDNPAVKEIFVEASVKKARFFSIERMVKEYEELFSKLSAELISE
jgi:N,N'-diacetylbacillosaminyl-diphospho-undecaprenol alpha-1,3-N-acetylgalactosaminyltransferase